MPETRLVRLVPTVPADQVPEGVRRHVGRIMQHVMSGSCCFDTDTTVGLWSLAGVSDEGVIVTVPPDWAQPLTPDENRIGQRLLDTFWERQDYTESL